MKLTKEQEDLRDQIYLAAQEKSKAWGRWFKIKESCLCDALENRGYIAVCVICGESYGRYCDVNSDHFCKHNDKDSCIKCDEEDSKSEEETVDQKTHCQNCGVEIFQFGMKAQGTKADPVTGILLRRWIEFYHCPDCGHLELLDESWRP